MPIFWPYKGVSLFLVESFLYPASGSQQIGYLFLTLPILAAPRTPLNSSGRDSGFSWRSRQVSQIPCTWPRTMDTAPETAPRALCRNSPWKALPLLRNSTRHHVF